MIQEEEEEEKKQFPQRAINFEKYTLFKIEVGLNFKKLFLKEKLGVEAYDSA